MSTVDLNKQKEMSTVDLSKSTVNEILDHTRAVQIRTLSSLDRQLALLENIENNISAVRRPIDEFLAVNRRPTVPSPADEYLAIRRAQQQTSNSPADEFLADLQARRHT